MARKTHNLNENDTMTYTEYLDTANAHNSADTAPTLIPVLEGSNVTMKSFATLLRELKETTIQNESLNTNATIQNESVTVDNLVLTEAQEGLTDALRAISTDHAYIHDGLGYRTYFEIGSVTDTEYFLLVPNEAKYLHFKNLELMALGGTCKVTLIRGHGANPLVIDSAGTEASEVIGPHNVNDNSIHTSGVVITKTPTYENTQEGEAWAILQVLGDSTNQFTSVAKTQSNPEEEFVMKPNTPYVIKVEKIGLDTPTNVLLTAFWYEEASGSTE